MGTAPPETIAPPYLYTSRDEMDSCFSEAGVSTRVEDLYSDKGPAIYLDDIIIEATDLLDQYCSWRYLESDLATSHWVRRRASWLACCIVSQRRGNPKQFRVKCAEIMSELQRVHDGLLHIPRLALRLQFVPNYANPVIDNRFVCPPQKNACRGKLGYAF